jgi:hypothetical protein
MYSWHVFKINSTKLKLNNTFIPSVPSHAVIGDILFLEACDAADTIFNIHFQLLCASWIVLVHAFFKKTHKERSTYICQLHGSAGQNPSK